MNYKSILRSVRMLSKDSNITNRISFITYNALQLQPKVQDCMQVSKCNALVQIKMYHYCYPVS